MFIVAVAALLIAGTAGAQSRLTVTRARELIARSTPYAFHYVHPRRFSSSHVRFTATAYPSEGAGPITAGAVSYQVDAYASGRVRWH